jgi:hypothetical protein
VKQTGHLVAIGARRALGVGGIVLASGSIWLAALNLHSGVAVFALGVNAVACGLLAYWGLARSPTTSATGERAVLALAAAKGTPLSEAEIALETGLSLAEVRVLLDAMRRQGVVEIVFRDGETLCYRVLGLSPALSGGVADAERAHETRESTPDRRPPTTRYR